MGTLYIAEYSSIASVSSILGTRENPTAAPQEPSVADQTVAINASSTQSAPFNGATHMIRVHCDSICSILIGVNPTALTTVKRLAANQTEYFGVTPGQILAVIQNV